MSVDFISPTDVLGTTTAFFGGTIDLDPASNEFANTVVGADKYFNFIDNGLVQSWKARTVYLYPPRDFLDFEDQPKDPKLFTKPKQFKKSAQRVWLEQALRKYNKQEYDEGIIFLTSTEVALVITQKLGIDLPLCVLKTRPKLRLDDNNLTKLNSVRCHGFILYVPAALNTEKRLHEFKETFSYLGRVYM
tara:strand:- start:11627 stop:12196 length:570 start_codon:yes stop_codon:yes gene_type:complete